MSVGSVVRALLGARCARAVGRAYRALFVDLAKAAAAIAQQIPDNAVVLDVGGGDGEPLNGLLALRSDIRVTTIDVAPSVGQWIAPAYGARVVRLPSTSLDRYLASAGQIPDVLLLSDVVHHIPVAERDSFFALLGCLIERSPQLRIIVKDVEPGHLRATIGYLSDRYITGDRGVQPISRRELAMSMQRARSGIRCSETSLFADDPPNYALVFWCAHSTGP